MVPAQYFILFVTDEMTQYARVLHNTRQKRLSNDKHSNLLVQFVSYEEKKCFECDSHSHKTFLKLLLFTRQKNSGYINEVV